MSRWIILATKPRSRCVILAGLPCNISSAVVFLWTQQPRVEAISSTQLLLQPAHVLCGPFLPVTLLLLSKHRGQEQILAAALVTRFISLLMSQPTFQEHWTKKEFPGATYLERLTDTCKSSHWHQRENHINWCHCRGLSSAPVLKSVNSHDPAQICVFKKT